MKHTYLTTILFLVFGVLFASCNNNSTETNPKTKTIKGTWKDTEASLSHYILIDISHVNEYEISENNTCYNLSKFNIHKITGDKYKLSSTNGSNDSETVTLKISNNILTITEGNAVITFKRSGADVSKFRICSDKNK